MKTLPIAALARCANGLHPVKTLPIVALACAVATIGAPGGAQTVAPEPVGHTVIVPGPIGSQQLAAGLTVVGRATVAVPADRMRVIVRLTPRNVTYAALDDLAKTVADAMRQAGIGDAHVALPLRGFLGPNSTVAIIGSVGHPTRESVEAILREALKAVPDQTAATLQNAYQVQTSLEVDDCTPAETRAQSAAIADARARAERAAAAAGLRLGGIIAINESGTFAPAACGAKSDDATPMQFSNDPYGSLSVPVSVTATVTFAIR